MFKVGDKVIASRIFLGLGQGEVGFETDEIRKAPVDPNWESCFVPEMLQYIGTELTVIRGNDVTIQLSPGSWWWSPLSLDKVEDMNKDINYFSRDELRRIASNKKIPGRGKMTKQELFYAIYDTKPVEKKKKEEISLGKKLLNKIKRTATCHYAHRCDKEEFFFSHDICHARLKNRKIDEAVLNVKWHYDHHDNKKLYHRFVEWMLNDSPFKNCFITKKWNDAYEDGVYLNCNESISRIVASAIALRGGSEYSFYLPLMYELVEAGYDPTISWFISYQFKKEGNKFYFSGDGGGNHKVFAIANANTENMKKFFKEGFHLLNDKPANQYASYYEVFLCLQGENYFGQDEKNLSFALHKQFNIPKTALFAVSERMSQKKFYEGLSKFQDFMLN